MRIPCKLLFVTLLAVACHKSTFEEGTKKGTADSAATSDNGDSSAETLATEPAVVAGAFLHCAYKDPDASDEVNCRLEREDAPLLLPNTPATAWRVMQEDQEVVVSVQDLDINTYNWQWSFPLARKGQVVVDMVLKYEGRAVAYSTTFSATAEATPAPAPTAETTPKDPALGFNYFYGQKSDYIVTSSLTGGLVLPPQECTKKLHTIPESLSFLTTSQMVFNYTVKENKTKTSLALEGICGQTQSGHIVEVKGPLFYKITTLPSDASRLVVLDKAELAAGDYTITVRALTFVVLQSEFFMFDKLNLQADKELTLGPETAK